jgi:hypothetical protein
MPNHRFLHSLQLLLATGGLLACTPSQQKPVVATAIDSDEARATSFEATLRVLDEHPEYVDELFARSRHHPKTLDRLLYNSAQHLHEEELAHRAAVQLTGAPAGLKMTLIASLEKMQDQPAALEAGAAAIEERPQEAAHMLVQRERGIIRTVHALVIEIQKKPEAARAFRQALSENSDAVAAVITKDPELVGKMVASISKAGVKRGANELEDLVSPSDDK